jgi:hypothetical protein
MTKKNNGDRVENKIFAEEFSLGKFYPNPHAGENVPLSALATL